MKFSIITVNLNNLHGLKKTVESVIYQTYKEFEFLIIDGDSNDGSKEFITNQSQQLSYWQSKPDKGIYDAMNIGIKNATGDYIIFLNSGDTFYNDDVLNKIKNQFNQDIVYGDIEVVGQHKTLIQYTPEKLTFGYFVRNTLPHQSAFIKRSLFYTYGFYNIDLKICADWTFFLDAVFAHNISYQHISLIISSFTSDGISSLPENGEIIALERSSHLEEKYKAFLDDYLENEQMIAKYKVLKFSRLRKILSVIFKQLKC